MRCVILALVVGFGLVTFSASGLWAQAPAAEAKPTDAAQKAAKWKTEVKPVTPKEGIDTGYFFAHGHYIEPPYAVTIEGRKVFVNRIEVAYLPVREATGKPKDPGPMVMPDDQKVFPKGFFANVLARYVFWWHKVGPEQAKKRTAAYLKSCPCVRRIELGDGGITVYDKAGKRGESVLLDYIPIRPHTEQEVKAFLENSKDHYEGALREGNAVFVHKGGEIGLPSRAVAVYLPGLVSAMDTQAPVEKQLELLSRLIFRGRCARYIVYNLGNELPLLRKRLEQEGILGNKN